MAARPRRGTRARARVVPFSERADAAHLLEAVSDRDQASAAKIPASASLRRLEADLMLEIVRLEKHGAPIPLGASAARNGRISARPDRTRIICRMPPMRESPRMRHNDASGAARRRNARKRIGSAGSGREVLWRPVQGGRLAIRWAAVRQLPDGSHDLHLFDADVTGIGPSRVACG